MHSANALVGTCKMGNASDDMAVVDSALKVSEPVESLRSCTALQATKKNVRSVQRKTTVSVAALTLS